MVSDISVCLLKWRFRSHNQGLRSQTLAGQAGTEKTIA